MEANPELVSYLESVKPGSLITFIEARHTAKGGIVYQKYQFKRTPQLWIAPPEYYFRRHFETADVLATFGIDEKTALEAYIRTCHVEREKAKKDVTLFTTRINRLTAATYAATLAVVALDKGEKKAVAKPKKKAKLRA
jgi:hypothetical protein